MFYKHNAINFDTYTHKISGSSVHIFVLQ
uniref:Uncharacterized protein n=1 Tax=Rhizophora mucronata TaxID=61149 RepID=A0A2P2QY41_RHIMU